MWPLQDLVRYLSTQRSDKIWRSLDVSRCAHRCSKGGHLETSPTCTSGDLSHLCGGRADACTSEISPDTVWRSLQRRSSLRVRRTGVPSTCTSASQRWSFKTVTNAAGQPRTSLQALTGHSRLLHHLCGCAPVTRPVWECASTRVHAMMQSTLRYLPLCTHEGKSRPESRRHCAASLSS